VHARCHVRALLDADALDPLGVAFLREPPDPGADDQAESDE